MFNELFNERELKKAVLGVKIDATDNIIVEEWLEKLKKKELVGEIKNYLKFFELILTNLLGYDSSTIAYEEGVIKGTGRVEFSLKNSNNKIIAICEVKGQGTNLDKPQAREKDRRTPVEQAFGYALNMKDIDWIIVTNYNEFRLYNFERKIKYISFLFEELKEIEVLKMFKGIFSFETLGEQVLPQKILSNTIIIEKELTTRFYDLYHETRLMIIKEFELLGKSQDESLHLAQVLLNRILFICFAEDSSRSLLDTQTLGRLLIIPIENKNVDIDGNEIWRTLLKLFNDLEHGSEIRNFKAFNGGLFAEELPNQGIRDLIKDKKDFRNLTFEHNFFLPDEISNRIDEKILNYLHPIYKNILLITSFDFESQLTEEILGHVFEQSISDIEKLKNNGSKTEKINRRKKEGIYYTPDSITHFIVEKTFLCFLGLDKNTLPNDIGSLISEWSQNISKLKKKVDKIKILDPACGSGAFLSACIDYLIRLHKAIHDERIAQGEFSGTEIYSLDRWLENIDLQRQIILNNIWGVDINQESVEITKLALFLRVASLEISLPHLDKRIHCGNSLIWDNKYSENAFSFESSIPEVVKFSEDRNKMKDGYGFDIIIGNPPYIRVQLIPHKEIDFFQVNYKSAYKKFDISILFYERTLRLLSKTGICTYITSKQYMTAAYGKNIREILSQYRFNFLVDFGGFKVFQDAITYTLISSITKLKPQDFLCYDGGYSTGKLPSKVSDFYSNPFEVSSKSLGIDEWKIIPKKRLDLLKKIVEVSENKFLQDYSDLPFGVITGKDKIFVLKDEIVKNNNLESSLIHPIVMGRDSAKWLLKKPNKRIIYPYIIESDGNIKLISEDDMKEKTPNIMNFLLNHKNELASRKDSRKTKGDKEGWWSLMRRGTIPPYFFKPKILVQGICKENRFYYDDRGVFYIGKGVTGIIPKGVNILYILAILNSKLAEFYYHSIAPQKQKGYFTYSKTFVGKLPIVNIEDSQQKTLGNKSLEIFDLIRKRRIEKRGFHKWINSQFSESFSKKLKHYRNINEDQMDSIIKTNLKSIKRSGYELISAEFKKSKKQLNQINREIIKLEKLIDFEIYKIYKLSDHEIEYIETSINIERQRYGKIKQKNKN